jgi:lipid II:glycine glycyltransferase (peptidoglycan interpeptide bridge formation enzyme)
MQSRFWAGFKARFGWQPHFFAVEDALPLLVLTRRIAPAFTLAYVPHGPELPPKGRPQTGDLAGLGAAVSRTIDPPPVLVRFDLPNEISRRAAGEGRGAGTAAGVGDAAGTADGAGEVAGLLRAPADVQPPDTVLIDLAPGEEELLAAMKAKTRYNVRLAGKKGVSVRVGRVGPAGGDDLDRWYGLYRETAERDRIAIHSAAYYRSLFDTADEFPEVGVSLLLAEHEGDLLSGIIVLRFGSTATYLYGASSNTKRNLMAPYALQWEAMRRARAAGAQTYDLFGIPPADDPAHPMHGLYRFKTGFGGRIIHRLGAHDYPAARGRYALYRAAERLRTFYYKRLRKR